MGTTSDIYYTTVPDNVVMIRRTSLQLDPEMNLHLHHITYPPPSLPPTDDEANPLNEKGNQQAIVICLSSAIGKSAIKAADEAGYKGYYRINNLDLCLFTKRTERPDECLRVIREKLEDRWILTISFELVLVTSLIENGVGLVLVFLKDALKPVAGEYKQRGYTDVDNMLGWVRVFKEIESYSRNL